MQEKAKAKPKALSSLYCVLAQVVAHRKYKTQRMLVTTYAEMPSSTEIAALKGIKGPLLDIVTEAVLAPLWEVCKTNSEKAATEAYRNERQEASASVCKCGQPWAHPCRCPENVMEAFTDDSRKRVFSYSEFEAWAFRTYKLFESDPTTITKIINDTLNLNGVLELGDSHYKSPFEVTKPVNLGPSQRGV